MTKGFTAESLLQTTGEASIGLPLPIDCGQNCARGELRLSDVEFDAVSKILSGLQNASTGFWKLEYSAEPCRKLPKKSFSGSLVSRDSQDDFGTRSTRSATGSVRRKSNSSQVSGGSYQASKPTTPKAKPKTPLKTSSSTFITNDAIENNNNSLLHQLPVLQSLTHGELWRKSCHRLITELCLKECALPFFSCPFKDISPESPSKLHRLGSNPPVSLSRILGRLEAGEYSGCEEVFSDVYTVWVAAFRSSKPGSYLWRQAQKASLIFTSMIDEDGTLTDKVPVKRDAEPQKESVPEVDSSNTTTANNNSTSSPKDKKEVKNPQTAHGISDEQRVNFQELLGGLSQDQHFMLFYRFQYTAVWKSLEDGVVELDDRATSPVVFREMEAWCQGEIGKSKEEAKEQAEASNKRHKLEEGL